MHTATMTFTHRLNGTEAGGPLILGTLTGPSGVPPDPAHEGGQRHPRQGDESHQVKGVQVTGGAARIIETPV